MAAPDGVAVFVCPRGIIVHRFPKQAQNIGKSPLPATVIDLVRPLSPW